MMDELERAVAAIETWFSRNAPAIVANLRPPASDDELVRAGAEGFLLTDEAHALYRLHDGQHDWEADLFLPSVGFLPLATGRDTTDRVLQDMFGCPAGHRTPVDAMRGHAFWNATDEQLFRSDEWTPHWFCLGASWDEAIMQHGRTGRVFAWPLKDGDCVVLGDTLSAALQGFARALEAGDCQISGDPQLPEVQQPGFVHRRRYVSWRPR